MTRLPRAARPDVRQMVSYRLSASAE